MKALLLALQANPNITHFHIDGIPLNSENQKILKELLSSRPGLHVSLMGESHSGSERDKLEEQLRELSKKFSGKRRIRRATLDLTKIEKPVVPFDPSWSAEEAWAHGYNPDGTPRTDDEWINHKMAFNPLWSAEEAWANG